MFKDINVKNVVSILKQNLLVILNVIVIFLMKLRKNQSVFVKSVAIHYVKLKNYIRYFSQYQSLMKQCEKLKIITEDTYYLNDNIVQSGYYSYDVQWEPLDDGFKYRHLLFDLIRNAPLAEELTNDEELLTTYKFIEKSTKPYQRKAIITDLKPGYETVIHKLDFEHQLCIFHLRQGLNKKNKRILQRFKNTNQNSNKKKKEKNYQKQK